MNCLKPQSIPWKLKLIACLSVNQMQSLTLTWHSQSIISPLSTRKKSKIYLVEECIFYWTWYNFCDVYNKLHSPGDDIFVVLTSGECEVRNDTVVFVVLFSGSELTWTHFVSIATKFVVGINRYVFALWI